MPLSDPSQFLMVKVDPDIVDMVDDFLENQRREVLKLRTALATDQWQTVRRIGHGLKGIGGMYGFSWITEAGRVIEQGDPEEIPKLAEQLEGYLKEVRYEAGDWG